ncbi:MAG TPA: MFS transporter [Solirubrobacteraceae bacterium]|nr:MFS transporter [Solirubrobacteraceae bacterium]
MPTSRSANGVTAAAANGVAPSRSPGGVERAAANDSLRRLQLATAATSLGKWAFALALGVYAYRKGGTGAVGLVALIQAIPAVLSAPFLSLAGDRYPRQRVLLATNALRALLLAAVAGAMLQDAGTIVVFALAALFSAISTANQPARAALIPVLARSASEVSSATALLGTIDTSSFLLGAGGGGLVLAGTSVQFLVALCCLAYCAATTLILRIPRDTRPIARAHERPLAALAAGAHTVLTDDRLRLVIGMAAVMSVIDGITNVFVIVAALRLLHTGTAGIGYLNIAWGVGGLAGGAVAFALFGRSRLTIALGLGSLALGIPFVLLGLLPSVALGVLAWGGLGFGSVLVKVSNLTTVQRLSGDRVLARVLGVLETTLVATIGLGAILAPGLESLLGLKGALIATGAALPLLAIARWPAIRRLELGSPVPQRAFALLRQCPLFAPLPLATIEGLARRLVPIELAEGTNVVTQGETGERFYLIDDGEVEVVQSGTLLRRQGPGESFGEIALLHEVARTATVRTITPSHLLALEREPFLLSVTGHTDSHDAGLEVAERFLRHSEGVEAQV